VAVEHGETGATVRCADGETIAATAVIVAVPLPLLSHLELDPAMPPAISQALGRRLFGDAAKLHIPLAAAPAPARVASPAALWWCWTSAAAGQALAAPVLSCFAGGTAAIEAVGATDGPDAWMAQALALRPDVAPADGDALVTHWGAEPWTRGSYSASAIGCTPADDDALTRAWGRVVLAGEHTAGAAAGTMNGAAASGARAATVVMNQVRAS
jgi:monoamine oxidase